MRTFFFSLFVSLMSLNSFAQYSCKTNASNEDLVFSNLAKVWDEGIPLGNATIGQLVWQKGQNLRFSLDRTDLWDERPTDSLSGDNYRFSWVKEQIRKGDYLPVQKKFDWPYDKNPAPSKLPGAALEFSLAEIGSPNQVRLYLKNALCEVKWNSGVTLKTFVHATKPVGWFVFTNLKKGIHPILVPPIYESEKTNKSANAVFGQSLQKLGYKQGKVYQEGNQLVYHQKGYGDFSYDVVVRWKRKGSSLYGVWSVTSSKVKEKAEDETAQAFKRGLKKEYKKHLMFWKQYWLQSSVQLPDKTLQKQYMNEMYKFGAAAREHSCPISLQAVWTADNGQLPPWKGDFHHDLNTQLSYWPAYIGNHLKEGLGYLNTLWKQRDVYKKYTAQYFEVDGMNVPGVTTYDGAPMGGWIQYAMSQTAGAWLAQHFYWHYKYSGDKVFLKERAYPFLKDVATFLENISSINADGKRVLEFSSSPEINDNSIKAWFPTMTNYDLSLMRFLFKTSAELARELSLPQEASHWTKLWQQLPALDTDEKGALTFAKGHPYRQSHRHFSHAMSIYPLELINWTDGESAKKIMTATLDALDEMGPDWWTGYSYTWLANMKARVRDGEGAVEALKTFAQCFCSPNTFHLNGDQTKTGKSKFTYRPFTLEGNFAFASAIHEMLLQSNTGTIYIFPALPKAWKDVSFHQLRAMGGFLISAEKKEGKVRIVKVVAEQGGTLRIKLPKELLLSVRHDKLVNGDTVEIETKKGQRIEFKL